MNILASAGLNSNTTNIVPSSCVLASVLTAVDLDHQAFLGNTVSLIAREKAGIAREGKPLVLGRQTHPEVVEVAKDVVGSVGGVLLAAAQVSVSEDDLPTWSLLGNTSTSPPSKVVQFHLSSFDRVIQARFPLQGGHQLDNLGTALGVIDAILSTETSFSSLNLKSRVTPQTLAAGIENVKWRGGLSFHTIPAPVQPSSTSTSTHTPNLPVLVDGVHNPASAHTLGTYISSLINATLSSLSNPSERNEVHIPITYILSVSHSPPKTPYQTLHPILLSSLISPSDSDPTIVLHPSVALLPFSPPDGMPWVRPTSLTEMSHAVREILPDLPKAALWVDSNLEETPDNGGATSRHDPKTLLRAALIWAASRHDRYAASSQVYSQGPVRYPGLVVLAGSLYLVAEFYRLLDEESSSVRG